MEKFKNSNLSKNLLTFSIMLASTLYALDWTIVVIAFPQMKGIFAATEDQIAWAVTSYVVASAIAMISASWASRKFGRKTIMIFSTAGFTISSLFCGAAETLNFEIFSRIIQGFTGGFIIPLSLPILLDLYQKNQRAKALTMWSIGAYAGSFIGPVLGGYIIEYLSWRWVFYINIPFGIICLLGIILFMKETVKEKNVRLDWTGFLSISIGVAVLQIMVDRGHRLDWFDSTEIIIEGIIVIISFYIFFINSLTAKEPFLNPRILSFKQFRIGIFLVALYGILQTPVLVIMPVFLESLIGYPIDLVGLLQLPRGVGLILAILFAGKLSGTINPKIFLVFGFAALTISNYEMSQWNLDVRDWSIIWTGVLQGVGAGFIMLPANEIAFHETSSEVRTEVSSVMNLVRSMCSSLGVSLTLVIYFINSGMSRTDLVSNINLYDERFNQQLNSSSTLSLLAQTNIEIEQQVSMLGHIGVFLSLSILSFFALIAVILMGKLKEK